MYLGWPGAPSGRGRQAAGACPPPRRHRGRKNALSNDRSKLRSHCIACVGFLLAVLAAIVACPGTSGACVGTACLEIFSTQDGGGALTIFYDFANKKVQTFQILCREGQCLYSAIDPGFITTSDPPPDGFHPLADGTNVTLEIVSIPPGLSLRVNGTPLTMASDSALLGTAPTLHTHPSWQLSLPEGEQNDYELVFKLTTDSPHYTASQDFHLLVTNLAPPTPTGPTASATPTSTPTPEPMACPGDCNHDGTVAINELIGGVGGALGNGTPCHAFDLNGDGTVTISELITAVNMALTGCPATPTPTVTAAAMFDDIQRNIFSPRCAIPQCHNPASKTGNLNLAPGSAYDQLVGVAPTVDTAREAGLLRVDPGHPENSFLLIKLTGPPPDQGSRMPLTGPLLNDAEVELIRAWIAQGANP